MTCATTTPSARASGGYTRVAEGAAAPRLGTRRDGCRDPDAMRHPDDARDAEPARCGGGNDATRRRERSVNTERRARSKPAEDAHRAVAPLAPSPPSANVARGVRRPETQERHRDAPNRGRVCRRGIRRRGIRRGDRPGDGDERSRDVPGRDVDDANRRRGRRRESRLSDESHRDWRSATTRGSSRGRHARDGARGVAIVPVVVRDGSTEDRSDDADDASESRRRFAGDEDPRRDDDERDSAGRRRRAGGGGDRPRGARHRYRGRVVVRKRGAFDERLTASRTRRRISAATTGEIPPGHTGRHDAAPRTTPRRKSATPSTAHPNAPRAARRYEPEIQMVALGRRRPPRRDGDGVVATDVELDAELDETSATASSSLSSSTRRILDGRMT